MSGTNTDADHVEVRVMWLPGATPIMLPINQVVAEHILSLAFHKLLSTMGLDFAIPDIEEHCEWLAAHTIISMSFTDEELPM